MKKKYLFILPGVLLITIVAFILFSFKVYPVSGGSMEPNFSDGEKIVVSRIEYLFKEPKRGDVVLTAIDGKVYIKRVVGISGEIISIRDGKVFIDDNQMTENYIKGSTTMGNQNVSLGKEQYYLLGDNREPNESTDSRIFGPVSKSKVIGKVVYEISNGLKSIDKASYTFGQ